MSLELNPSPIRCERAYKGSHWQDGSSTSQRIKSQWSVRLTKLPKWHPVISVATIFSKLRDHQIPDLRLHDHPFREFFIGGIQEGLHQKRRTFSSVQSLSRVRLCNPMNRSTPGLPVHHQLPEFTQTHVHRVGDAIQPSHPLSSPTPPAPNPSQHQSLFQWVNSLHEVAKVLEFQL